MKVIKDINWVPPGGWQYVHPETKTLFASHSINVLTDKVRAFNQTNNYPNQLNLEQAIVDGVCDRCPECCHDTEPPSLLDLAKRFTREAYQWAQSGFEVTDENLFASRQATCNTCPKWRGEAAFGYGRCGACGCTGLKLFMKSSHCPDGKW